jgi:hypothetical protein
MESETRATVKNTSIPTTYENYCAMNTRPMRKKRESERVTSIRFMEVRLNYLLVNESVLIAALLSANLLVL